MQRREPPTLRALVPWWFNPVFDLPPRHEDTKECRIEGFPLDSFAFLGSWRETAFPPFPGPPENASLVWAASPPSLVLGRSWKSADARHHELRGCPARSALPSSDLWPPNPGMLLPQRRRAAGHSSGARTCSPQRGRGAGRGACARPMVDPDPDSDLDETPRLPRRVGIPFKIQNSTFNIQHSKLGRAAAPEIFLPAALFPSHPPRSCYPCPKGQPLPPRIAVAPPPFPPQPHPPIRHVPHPPART